MTIDLWYQIPAYFMSDFSVIAIVATSLAEMIGFSLENVEHFGRAGNMHVVEYLVRERELENFQTILLNEKEISISVHICFILGLRIFSSSVFWPFFITVELYLVSNFLNGSFPYNYKKDKWTIKWLRHKLVETYFKK